jgi:cytochrome c
MKLIKMLVLAAAATLTAAPAFASLDLAKSKQCMSCHGEDKKVVGPAYKDVAAKYKGQADAVAKLTAKIKNGSSGAWGPVPMPANKVTDEEAKTLAEWVMKR